MRDEQTWRVYQREWMIIYTCMGDGPECQDYFASRYKGRVRDGDVRVRVLESSQQLELNLWNLRGEYKDYADAVSLAGELTAGDDGVLASAVVQRGSAEERSLLDYGRKMLSGAG